MLPWALAERFGVPYPQERSSVRGRAKVTERGAGKKGSTEKFRWELLDCPYSHSDSVNPQLMVQDTELRLDYGRSFTPARFLHGIRLAGLLQDTALS